MARRNSCHQFVPLSKTRKKRRICAFHHPPLTTLSIPFLTATILQACAPVPIFGRSEIMES